MRKPLTYLRYFAHIHDDLPAFHAGYLVLTFLVAALFNMGAFGLLIVAHMSLDIVKYREVHGYSWRRVLEGTFLESLVDLTLLLIGLTFAVYLHHSVAGVASLSGLMRAEITIIRAFGTIIPKLKILHHFLKVVAHIQHYMEFVHPHLRTGFTTLERVCLFSLGATTLLLFGAPSILGLELVEFHAILLEELIPWNF